MTGLNLELTAIVLTGLGGLIWAVREFSKIGNKIKRHNQILLNILEILDDISRDGNINRKEITCLVLALKSRGGLDQNYTQIRDRDQDNDPHALAIKTLKQEAKTAITADFEDEDKD